MNRSGIILKDVLYCESAQVNDILIVCDNLDLKPGMCRLKERGSSGGHRGLSSVIEYAGTNNFLRLYIGIGKPNNKADISDYVLNNPEGEEKQDIESGIEKAILCTYLLLEKTPQEVMTICNSKNPYVT